MKGKYLSGAKTVTRPSRGAPLPVIDFKLPLPFALIWRKDNATPLLAGFVADVKLLPEVTESGVD